MSTSNIDFTETLALLTPIALKVSKVVLILIIGIIAIKLIKKALRKSMLNKKSKVDKSIATFIISVVDITLKAAMIIAIIAAIGIETASIITLLGTISLSIGFALQGSLANFASGVILLILRPYKVDDYVKCGDKAGTVTDMNIFSTQLLTIDNKTIFMPNSIMLHDPLINYNLEDKRRVDITIGVDYSSEIDKVKNVILKVIYAHKDAIRDPEPIVRVIALNESSIDFTVRVWTQSKKYFDVLFDLNEGIKEALDENNIEIPYPHLTVIQK